MEVFFSNPFPFFVLSRGMGSCLRLHLHEFLVGEGQAAALANVAFVDAHVDHFAPTLRTIIHGLFLPTSDREMISRTEISFGEEQRRPTKLGKRFLDTKTPFHLCRCRGGRAEMRWTRDPVALRSPRGSNPFPGAIRRIILL